MQMMGSQVLYVPWRNAVWSTASMYPYQNIYCDLIGTLHKDARQIQKNEIFYRTKDPFFLSSQCRETKKLF